MPFLLLLLLGGLMHAASSFAPQAGIGSTPGAIAMGLGYLLLSAFLAGDIFERLRLPRLTGYLATGLIVGPSLLNLVSEQMVVNLRVFSGVAIALIALSAGSELNLRSVRPLLRTVGWITAIAVCGTAVALAGLVYLLRDYLPFLGGLTTLQTVAVAMVLGAAMAAQSPAVVVAFRDELDARGPLTQTVLAVVVLSDIVVILLFGAASSFATAVIGAGANLLETTRLLAREIGGSAVAGVVIGAVVALFLRKVKTGGGLFVVGLGFVVAEVGQRIRLDPLVLALVAGLFIRNVTDLGERLHAELESATLPVYVAFFAVAGATIHLQTIFVVGLPAVLFVAARAISLLLGTRAATRIAGSPGVVRRYAGFGLLPQAGLALALALLLARTFPDFGTEASMLVFAVVAINELLAPIGYRAALARSGEAGKSAIAIQPPGYAVVQQ